MKARTPSIQTLRLFSKEIGLHSQKTGLDSQKNELVSTKYILCPQKIRLRPTKIQLRPTKIKLRSKKDELGSKEVFSPKKPFFLSIFLLHPPIEPSGTPETRRSPASSQPVSTRNRKRSLSKCKSIAEYSCVLFLRSY